MEHLANDVTVVQLSISEATCLCSKALENAGYSTSDAEMITKHLVDAELRGGPFAGLARALSIIDHLQSSVTRSSKYIEVVREGAAFVRLDGHDAIGYLVA
ncbi:uncharacterized protein A1O9_04622 [Exophiala aquamarina CBS 119918]|uniref:Uncharacterized protein n=1 Tax=Exophiala aquamarina CBS 119918 TaxID=1182545 RepID=A0A072PI72_9EURO|nr:uncharacterized protein A1O9_04622 [Exophiala aquamarina CBS 119918]KEF59774.1 hypothetical protein A1O9_04622 [Exophiala aquamarina CBS 119918]